METKVDYQFYFKLKKKLTPEIFLENITSVEEAVLKLENHGLFNIDLEEVSLIVEKNNRETVVEENTLDQGVKTKAKPKVTRKTTPKRKPRRKNENSKNTSDSKTWKVPYVEP